MTANPARGPTPPLPDDLIPHPRYGKVPRRSDVPLPPETPHSYLMMHGHRGLTAFPDTVVLANSSLHRYGPIAYLCYVDLLLRCLTCGRPFLFFAEEQQHWY